MPIKNFRNYFSGLSGIELPIPKYQFPEKYQNSSRLTYYSSLFNSIEINRSFYKIPLHRTVERWALSVGEDFRFTFKLSKDITHIKNLIFEITQIENFLEAISHIGAKKGCILVQFPPRLSDENIFHFDELLRTMKIFPKLDGWRLAVEFRNKSWYHDAVYDILKTNDATLVIHDIPTSATPLANTSSQVVYVRFHGPTGNYRGSYTDAFLMEYAGYVTGWLTEGKIVYLYFNNTAGDAFNNLSTLNRYVLRVED